MAPSPSGIQLLILDVDGVLTDGGIYLDDAGRETKRFHVRDGVAIRGWMRDGRRLAVITGRQGMVVHHRMCELGVREVIQGRTEKLSAYQELIERLDIDAEHTAMLADDLPDLPILQQCGYPMAVADAAAEVRATARFITTRSGGHGAVREAIQHLLQADDAWTAVINHYLDPQRR